jgi:hypothetical protein
LTNWLLVPRIIKPIFRIKISNQSTGNLTNLENKLTQHIFDHSPPNYHDPRTV